MAAEAIAEEKPKTSTGEDASRDLLLSYLGISFAVFLGFLPRSSVSYLASLQSRSRILSLKLLQAEDQLKQLRSRRREDSKANARVAEIFASHRNAWQQEEKRLLVRVQAAAEEIDGLRDRIAEMERTEMELRESAERLQREVSERDEMLDFMSRGTDFCEKEEIRGEFARDSEESGGYREYGGDLSGGMGKVRVPEGLDRGAEVCFVERDLDEMALLYGQHNGFGRGFSPPPAGASHPWTDSSNGWQDLQHESFESMRTRHLVARRESPWKVDGESTGVSSKLKLLEQELINLEKVGKGDMSKAPSLMRKQAKRYQSLAEKIDDLCRRMQVSDPCDPTLSAEFRNQRQTEFLLEAFRLQNRATETRQKLTTLQAGAARGYQGDELAGQAKLSTRRSLDSIRNNFKEIQRNLEIWLARIMGDLEGILARDGASRVRDYYVSRYPFVR